MVENQKNATQLNFYVNATLVFNFADIKPTVYGEYEKE